MQRWPCTGFYMPPLPAVGQQWKTISSPHRTLVRDQPPQYSYSKSEQGNERHTAERKDLLHMESCLAIYPLPFPAATTSSFLAVSILWNPALSNAGQTGLSSYLHMPGFSGGRFRVILRHVVPKLKPSVFKPRLSRSGKNVQPAVHAARCHAASLGDTILTAPWQSQGLCGVGTRVTMVPDTLNV